MQTVKVAKYQVQTSYRKGSYTVRYAFPDLVTATRWYDGINTHSGYNKRLVNTATNRVLKRYRSNWRGK